MKNRTTKGIILSFAILVLLAVSTLLFASCGAEPTETIEIRYEAREDGILITGYEGVLAKETDFIIPSSIDGKDVVAIADGAFEGRDDLVKITLPATVKEIGKRAFKNCKNLEYVNIPEKVSVIGDETFLGCSKLKEVFLPEGISEISESAYKNCVSIEHLTAPAFAIERFELTSLKSLNVRGAMEVTAGMLKDSKRLETLTIPYVGSAMGATENTHFGYIFGAASASENASFVPSTLTKVVITGASADEKTFSAVDSKAFYGCSSIKNIILPNSVKSIGESAFENCSALTKLTIPALVTAIGDSAFANTDIESAVIPAGVESIGKKVFYGCDNLNSLTIGKNVKTVGDEAFVGCTALTSVSVNSIEQWLSFNFESHLASPLYYAGALYIGGVSAESIVIPESVTKINANAFYRCTNVKSITLPSTLTEIGDYAFAGCTSLSEIKVKGGASNTLPKGLESVGYAAFSNCQSLTEITIPESVTALGEYAFNLCSSLKTLNLNANITSIGASTFRSTALVTLNVTSPITSCGADAFAGVERIQNASIPLVIANAINTKNLRSVTILNANEIPAALFMNAKNLEEVYMPSTVASVGDYAFAGCKSLKVLDFGANSMLSAIGTNAFKECEMLTSFTIPEGVTQIASEAFSGCIRLREVRNLSTAFAVNAGDESFGGVAKYALSVLTDSATPSSYVTVGNYLFFTNGNDSLLVGYLGKNTVITLPDTFEYTIASYAFANSDVRVITIPSSAVGCEPNAFLGTSSIVELEAPTWILSAMPDAAKANIQILSLTAGNEVTAKDFSGLSAIRELTLCSSVVNVSAYDLAMLQNLEKINVDAKNSVYFSTDGHLYKKGANGNILVRACPMTADYFTLDTTIVEIGDYAFYNCDMLTSVYIEDGSVLNRIGVSAFYDCDIIYSLELPSTVSVIGKDAFALCDYISDIEFTKENPYYTIVGGCLIEKATKTLILGFGAKVGDQRVVTIPADGSVIKIAENAIAERITLQKIIIPAGVEIAENALKALPALEEIAVTGENGRYKVVSGCLIETESGKLIMAPGSVYNAQTGKTEPLKIPADIKIILSSAFAGNSAITTITIPDTVLSIEDGAFEGCTSLNNVTAPAWAVKYFDKETVTSLTVSSGEITKDTLAGFTVLESFTVGAGVGAIDEGAFKDSALLSKIAVNESNTAFKVVNGCLIDVEKKTVITAVSGAEVKLPDADTVTKIGEYAFAGKTIGALVIPATVTEIAENAFLGIKGLKTIAIPAEFIVLVPGADVTALTVSGGSALTADSLRGFTALQSIVISSSVSSIDEGVFLNCSALSEIKIEGEGGAYVVKNGCLIHVATKTLVAGVGTASIPLDNSVSVIAAYAFANNTKIVDVAIPAGVTIGKDAFLGCTSLERVFYAGNDWTEDSANSSCPDGVTVYTYSKSKPTTEGNFWYIKDEKIVIWW